MVLCRSSTAVLAWPLVPAKHEAACRLAAGAAHSAGGAWRATTRWQLLLLGFGPVEGLRRASGLKAGNI